MDTKDNLVKAYGDVTVIYKDYFLTAKSAIYDRKSGELELFDNIRATKGSDYQLLGSYAKLNIAKKERVFKPFYMLEKTSNVWLSGDEGCAKDKNMDIDSGIMSGCNPNDPLWKMEFSSSTYNSDSKWLNLYNTIIYIYDIPVIYTPYFGYSLDTKRRSGLLTPALGISDSEGFYYEQPIYIAEQNWWDLELKPQTRTNRGYGGYAKFRFVDSKISKGSFTTGYFKEKDDYYVRENLANDSHYGFNLEYDNGDFINQWFGSKFDGQSGLYVDINNMNDVDYINLSTNDTTQNSTATQLLSRVNLFYNTDDNYFGSYFKYYMDLTKESNEDTLQKLPTFQYHYYLDTLLEEHLHYNLDLQSNNIYRDINKRVVQTDLNIPITLQTSLFDEYLNISYKAQLYAQHSSFSGDEKESTGEYNDGYFARNYNILQASTQLTRPYDNFTHVAEFGARYTVGGSEVRAGFYEDLKDFCSDTANKDTPQCEFYKISDIEEEVQLDFTQYFYTLSGQQKIYHRLTQNISYDREEDQVGELENELDYKITKSISFYNNMFYNYGEKSFSKNYNKVSYSNQGFVLGLSHMYKDSFKDETSPYTSYITSSASYTYNKHYSYFVNYDYDTEISLKKSAGIGFLYKKRCWNFGLKYLENNRPVLIKGSASSIYDRYIYFNIVLKPLMPSNGSTSDFAVRLPEILKGS